MEKTFEKALFKSSEKLVEKQVEKNKVFLVTNEGVELAKGGKIPSNLIENPFRSSSYGIGQGRNFIEKLRIDPARFAELSHFHVNGQPNKLKIWRWF